MAAHFSLSLPPGTSIVNCGGVRRVIPCFHPRPIRPTVHVDAVSRFEKQVALLESISAEADAAAAQRAASTRPITPLLPSSSWDESDIAVAHPGAYAHLSPGILLPRGLWGKQSTGKISGRPTVLPGKGLPCPKVSDHLSVPVHRPRPVSSDALPADDRPQLPLAKLAITPPPSAATRSVSGANKDHPTPRPTLAAPELAGDKESATAVPQVAQPIRAQLSHLRIPSREAEDSPRPVFSLAKRTGGVTAADLPDDIHSHRWSFHKPVSTPSSAEDIGTAETPRYHVGNDGYTTRWRHRSLAPFSAVQNVLRWVTGNPSSIPMMRVAV